MDILRFSNMIGCHRPVCASPGCESTGADSRRGGLGYERPPIHDQFLYLVTRNVQHSTMLM